MVTDTLSALELGAVEDLIVWENLDMDRIVLRNTSSSEEKIVHLSKEQQQNDNFANSSRYILPDSSAK